LKLKIITGGTLCVPIFAKEKVVKKVAKSLIMLGIVKRTYLRSCLHLLPKFHKLLLFIAKVDLKNK
jgi:hypothetical protein